jgi:hypothetical protein
MTTQIVVDTLNRLPELQRTLKSIWYHTTSPYRLHVIDDASTDGNPTWLVRMKKRGKIHSLTLRRARQGIPANWNEAAHIGDSEILVYTNGDVLCPKLTPDWLAQGLDMMHTYPDLGLLSLNDPLCTARQAWVVVERRAGVTLTDRVPSFFMFVRRALMQAIVLPDVGGRIHHIPITASYKGIDRAWSRAAQAQGYVVGYLPRVYCQHIGYKSVRTGKDFTTEGGDVMPVNLETLEPPEEYRG